MLRATQTGFGVGAYFQRLNVSLWEGENECEKPAGAGIDITNRFLDRFCPNSAFSRPDPTTFAPSRKSPKMQPNLTTNNW